jgi:hypothetical protein
VTLTYKVVEKEEEEKIQLPFNRGESSSSAMDVLFGLTKKSSSFQETAILSRQILQLLYDCVLLIVSHS